MTEAWNSDGTPNDQLIRQAGAIPHASQIPNNSTYPGTSVGAALTTLYSTVGARKQVTVEDLAIDTLNDEQSTAIGEASTVQFTPTHAIVHMVDVGAGDAANGDVEITIGTAAGGTQLLTATAVTGLSAINSRYVFDLTGTVRAAMPGNGTLFVKVTTADTTAGAGHLANVHIFGELVTGA